MMRATVSVTRPESVTRLQWSDLQRELLYAVERRASSPVGTITDDAFAAYSADVDAPAATGLLLRMQAISEAYDVEFSFTVRS